MYGSLSILDEEDLQEMYNLQMCIEEARQNFMKYDMDNVFTIVKFDPITKDVITIGNLFKKHIVITMDEVAPSNKFYKTWVKQDNHPCGYVKTW